MEKILLKVDEAAQQLGVSRATVYEMVGRHEIGVVRVGRAIRIPLEQLHEWSRQHTERNEAVAEPEPGAA